MPSFVVEQDRWGFFRIVDTRSGTRDAYTTTRTRAEEVVQRLNELLDAPGAGQTVSIPDVEPVTRA